MNHVFTPFVAALVVAVAAPGSAASFGALADHRAPADARGPDVPRVESFQVPGSSIERVRATVAVGAPIDRVRAVVFDFARYPELVPGYKQASVIRTTPSGGGVVQMVIEQLGGMVQIRMKIDISAPRIGGAIEAYDGRLLKGNVKAYQGRWELEALGPRRTRLMLESFLDPDLPLVPASLVNQGARDGIREAILALKARSEGRR